MSGKLDQSLEEITGDRRRSVRRRNPQRRVSRPTTTAPVGGVHKATKPARGANPKAPQGRAAAVTGDSKIIVSNLPKDVSEPQIKEYFNQSVGGIKRVDLAYGPNSQSRGIANITFKQPDGASKAFQKLNGLLVDNRPIKIEIVVGAAQADKVIPAVKSLAERATQPKAQPKSATGRKNATNTKGAVTKANAGKAAKGRKGRSARPAKKTADELDSEMADYFKPTDGNANAAAPAATGDAAMEEDIM